MYPCDRWESNPGSSDVHIRVPHLFNCMLGVTTTPRSRVYLVNDYENVRTSEWRVWSCTVNSAKKKATDTLYCLEALVMRSLGIEPRVERSDLNLNYMLGVTTTPQSQ
jgi:hypothetical protein